MTLPDGWKRGQLGELCSIEIGGTPSRDIAAFWDPDRATSNVWVSIKDMRQRLVTSSAEHISELGVKKSNVKLQYPGTVLLSFKLTIGKVSIAGVPLYTNEAIAGLSPNGLTRDFLFQGLQGWDLLQGVDQAIKGATLNKQKLKKISFEYPESEREQAKIAEVLSTVDRAIEQTEALIAKQQRIKTGLIQDLLTRGIDEHGNLRSEQTHQFKDSPLGRIPVEWEVSSIGAEFEIQLGKMLSQDSKKGRNPLPYLGNKNVQWGKVDLTNLELMDFDEGERKKFRLESGDVLVCEGGEVGRTCLWRGEMEECFFQKAIHRLRPKRGYHPSLFLVYMRWAVRNGLLSDFTSQSSIAHLTKEKLASVPICVLSEFEQMRISNEMGAIDGVIESHSRQVMKFQAIKRGLMQDLLTGNRRVTALLEQREAAATP